jgi:DNA (cytosine-5)-methyltransferase 1
MKHLGDITKINGAEIEPVDVITGGSPCQDLSVAGKRAGLAGERSGLFMEQIRVIKEMRQHERDIGRANDLFRPRYTWSGKTSPERSAPTKARTSAPSLKKSAGSRTVTPMFLNLQTQNGQTLGASWETDGLSLGEYTTRSFGECPSVAVESRLSQILEDNPHPKYFLSAKACQGILRRAERRGKELPPMLKEALMSAVCDSDARGMRWRRQRPPDTD